MPSFSLSDQDIGLGLRREFLDDLLAHPRSGIDFFELAPENWIGFGGRPQRQLRQLTEAYPFIAHGLSLSIAGPEPLDTEFLQTVQDFLSEHDIHYYSEHLAFCADHGQLYDLLPLPLTENMLDYVAGRIQQVQDFLNLPLIIENTAYYGDYAESSLSEQDFLLGLLHKSGCNLLLDLNNLYVNSSNHHYDARAFLRAIPAESIVYQHIAGHQRHGQGWLIDTHDTAVDPAVWALLQYSRELFGSKPTLLEWDNQIPPLPLLLQEAQKIRPPENPHVS
ncbi:DUF692 domain-containing protein [Acidithiobacillus montserratensis]|uniref:DUF692 domain-containing protein n=1 Tax=Acidithiobacillus montserratensis TaxID=2729135 RepID=A0ACD5HGA6_9PROT|nr:DUF692 domain-containing protein [Acidithiobacillus montserratensis]MBN2680265.1 DUF692 domain-containing protein [Acidithiobacillaceae bacterium]MBU2746825.1 DUF692 domain-containing protein [Acidithiobacillus montserratensis]